MPRQAIPPARGVRDLTHAIERQLRRAGQPVRRIVRVYPPRDTTDPAEVLFLDDKGRALTAYVYEGDDDPLIAVGW